MEEKIAELDQLISKVDEVGLDIIEQMARDVLAKRQVYKYFVMSVGGWIFIDFHGRYHNDERIDPTIKTLSDFLLKYKSQCFPGCPMLIQRNEPRKITWDADTL